MFLIYNILLILAIIFLFPVIILKIITDKNLKLGIKSRLSIYPKDFIKNLKNSKNIWIHASSVGEVNIAIQVVKSLKKELNEEYKYLITTMTITGNNIAKKSNLFDFVTFVPFDLPFIIKRFLKFVSPQIILIAETEFWPNIFYLANKKNIPLIVFNCRISDKTINNYLKFKFFFKKVLNCAEYFLCQNRKTMERLIKIGVKKDKIVNAKNIKFDIELPTFNKQEILKEFKIEDKSDFAIITAGSTHHNEEEILINTFLKLKQKVKNIFLILVPRHPERIEEISNILLKKNIYFNIFSKSKNVDSDILIIDTMGFLIKAYSISYICFIGGSLILRGGHNPLEAIYYKKPVISGKNIFNFTEVYQMLQEANGVILINNEEELEKGILHLLDDKNYYNEIAENGYKVLTENKGALKITLSYINQCLS